MQTSSSMLQELEAAVSSGVPERRRAALSYATDLLIAGSYNEQETWMFGEVLGLLASEIEASARAELAQRLATVAQAPANVIRRLAFDDSIEVAGPVLRSAQGLSVDALVENASQKSQQHLLAISQRATLHEDVTDVLVARGNRDVVRSVARNAGARFSESGFWRLVQRSEDDIVLTLAVGVRKDIPRHHFQKLIAHASEEARAKLAAARPDAAAEIQQAVADVTGAIQARLGPASRSYYAARRHVDELYRQGQLSQQAIGEFCRQRKFEEVTVALSLVCELPVDVTERALLDDRGQMALIVAKAANLSWAVTRQVLLLCAGEGGIAAHDLEKAHEDYSVLSAATAQRVMSFYRARQGQSGAGGR